MEYYFATMFEGVRHERSLLLLLSVTEPDILKQSKFRDNGVNVMKNYALERLHRQRVLKESFALQM